ncbi:MAG: hypothetical protein HY098_02490 [Nitrospinae bacterium]|nr:hypothetical protein [Nitrospinota bacterium]
MSAPPSGRGWELLAGLFILAVYFLDMLAFLPNHRGLLGHDWMYFLPSMLDGYYGALADGFFNVHWFTPAYCGGVPKFPNPQDPYFSVPQWLFFWGGPIYALRVTVVVFGALGFVGTYLLSRALGLGKPGSLVGASVFLFNGFFAAGMIIGHLTKHAFMLLPLVCYFLVMAAEAAAGGRPVRRSAPWIAAGAACLAYVVYSGGFVIFPVMLLSALGIGVMAAIFKPGFRLLPFAAAFVCATAFALALSAAKIAAVSAFLHNFPRDFYPLPLIPKAADLWRLFTASVFGDAASLDGSKLFTSYRWSLELHEFDFGITWAPAAFMAVGAVVWLERGAPLARGPKYAFWCVAALSVVLAVPLALNFYTPWWQAVLKSLPVLRHSTNNVRWMASYVLVFSVLSAKSVDYVFTNKTLGVPAGLFCSLLVANLALFPSREAYQNQPYNPKEVSDAYDKAAKNRRPPEVIVVGAIVDNGVPFPAMGRNDLLAAGFSSLLCYEPVFGYNLETFPLQTLHLGGVMDEKDGPLNLKNPACMVFPSENGCKPGDHFKAGERGKAARFTGYKSFDFKVPTRQPAANAVTLASLFLLAVVMAASLFNRKAGLSGPPPSAPAADIPAAPTPPKSDEGATNGGDAPPGVA